MSNDSSSTRRAFLKGGAIVAAPLAAIGAPAAALAADDSKDRLARLEDETAIRALHGRWLQQVSRGEFAAAAACYADDQCACALAGLRSISSDSAGEIDGIDLARDGRRAQGRFSALVEVETFIAPDHTLAQMLHAQGEGTFRKTERRLLKADYVRTREGDWAIAKLGFEQV